MTHEYELEPLIAQTTDTTHHVMKDLVISEYKNTLAGLEHPEDPLERAALHYHAMMVKAESHMTRAQEEHVRRVALQDAIRKALGEEEGAKLIKAALADADAHNRMIAEEQAAGHANVIAQAQAIQAEKENKSK